MALVEILDKKFINLPNKHFDILLSQIKKGIANESFDTSLFRGLGKGKWLLNFVSIEGNKIHIISLSANEILIKFLKKIIPNNSKSHIYLTSELNFWGEEKSDKKTKIIKDLINSLIIQTEIKPVDKELSAYKLKAEGNMNKNVLIKILQNFYKIFYSKKFILKEIELSIKRKTNEISIYMDPREINMDANLSEKELLKIFNPIMFCKNIETPCYYLHYLDIKNIKGDWTSGKREGYLIKEYGSLENKKQEKFKL